MRVLPALTLGLMFSLAAQAETPDLMKTARTRLARAEAALERARIEARRARAEASTKLDAALSEAAAARSELDRARELLDQERQASTRDLQAKIERWSRDLWVTTSTGGTPPSDIDRLRAGALSGLRSRLEALSQAARASITEESLLGRDGVARTAPVVRVGAALSVAAGEEDDTTGFLVASEGLDRVSGAKLDEESSAAVRALAREGAGSLPVDVDGTLARSDAPMRRTLLGRIESGGLFVWPIFLVGVLGMALLAERAWFFISDRMPEAVLRRALGALARGNLPLVRELVEGRSDARARVLRRAVEVAEQPADAREAAMESALLEVEPLLQRSLSIIAACAAIAPLLGLLGTVTGMITTFDVITLYGTGNPRLLSGGISVALVTTQLGLVVAVPLLLGHAVVSRVAQRRGSELESIRAAVAEEEGRS